mmetsp:Transcript_2515/g.5807  ORF Transcript_2515/g.5807 Transcript_2515/m.5807 type:complete len:196 (-) Transcript_2515:249-836(-)
MAEENRILNGSLKVFRRPPSWTPIAEMDGWLTSSQEPSESSSPQNLPRMTSHQREAFFDPNFRKWKRPGGQSSSGKTSGAASSHSSKRKARSSSLGIAGQAGLLQPPLSPASQKGMGFIMKSACGVSGSYLWGRPGEDSITTCGSVPAIFPDNIGRSVAHEAQKVRVSAVERQIERAQANLRRSVRERRLDLEDS